jgi:hypothetical protein
MTTQPNDALVSFLVFLLMGLAFALTVWGRIFIRAGYPRWHSLMILLPFFNLYVIGKMTLEAGYRIWWALLIFVPFGVLGLSFKLAYADEWPAEKMKLTVIKQAKVPAYALRTSPIVALAGTRVQTFDNTLRIFEDSDFQSAVKSEVPYGTVLQLGATTEIAGREWIEVTLPDGTAGYVLASSVRSHAIIL